MKLHLSISGKIGLGFGVLTIAYVFISWLTFKSLQSSKEENQQIISIYQPSATNLEKLQNLIATSRLLLKNWVFVETETITPDKIKFNDIVVFDIPPVENNLLKIYHQWPQNEQIRLDIILKTFNDTLFVLQKQITSFLNKQDAYNDKVQLKEFQALLGADGRISSLTDKLFSQLTLLLEDHKVRVKSAQESMNESFEHVRLLIIIASILLIVLAIIISYVTIHSQVAPINYIKQILISMGNGILPNEKIKEGRDEIGEISAALNSLVKGLKDISNFAIEIGKGNFNSNFTPLSKEDDLGNSLIKMREELRSAAIEEEKRKKEDDQRNWATQGIAKFSEILRQNNNNINELSYNIISNIVNYLCANQGGIFIINDNEKDNISLEMAGCYAYNRQKFLQKEFKPGEGLIGRCYQERATIHLTEIPKDYIKITSGLGDDNPTSLIVVPLLYNEKVFGVIEMASFSVFEAYQIEFIEKIATSIASTISAVKINIQTAKLLEQSRQQAEEMASQEEEMRQNMEELRATQEENSRKESALQKEVKELRKKLSKYEI